MMKTKISRRSFLKGAAASAALAATMGMAFQGSAAEAPVEGAESNWLSAPDPIAESEIAEVVETEILVVGGGVAGVTAATTAVESGAKTILLEKGLGAVGAHWIGAVNSTMQKEKGMVFDRDEIVNDLMWHANYRADQRLIQLWFDHSGEMIDWYTAILDADGSMCVAIELEEKDTGGRHLSPRTPHVPILGEFKLMGVNETGLSYSNEIVRKHALHLGLDYRTGVKAEQLVQEDDGSISGVIAYDANAEKYILFTAKKGVILCTGGYIANHEMREALNPAQNRTSVPVLSATANCTGDGIRMAMWCGAQLSDLHWWMDNDRGLYSGRGWRPGSQPWLRVNCFGERFCNEDVPYDYGTYAGSLNPDHFWWDIFDSDYFAQMDSFATTICSRMTPRPGGLNTEQVAHTSEEFYERYIAPFLATGDIVCADTIEELAVAMTSLDDRITPEALKATVDRYNELAYKRHDDDFGKLARRLLPIENGPFYAVWQNGSSLCNLDGLRINTNCEVIGADGKALGGLYAVGNDCGGYFGISYPWYYGGLNCGIAMTYARVAAKDALAK